MEAKVRTLGELAAAKMRAELDLVGRDDGARFERLVVRHPGGVVVLPLLEGGRTVLVRQFRYAVGRQTLELPAGKIEPGESPLEAAARELAEETGLRAARFEPLLRLFPAPGYSSEVIHAFAAHGASQANPQPGEKEIIGLEQAAVSDLPGLVLAGRILDSTTITALAAFAWRAQRG